MPARNAPVQQFIQLRAVAGTAPPASSGRRYRATGKTSYSPGLISRPPAIHGPEAARTCAEPPAALRTRDIPLPPLHRHGQHSRRHQPSQRCQHSSPRPPTYPPPRPARSARTTANTPSATVRPSNPNRTTPECPIPTPVADHQADQHRQMTRTDTQRNPRSAT